MMAFLRMRWLFNRHVAWTLLCFMVLIGIAVVVNIIGVRLAGDIDHWMTWLKTQAAFFLIWRLCLYSAVAYGWWWMRQRVIRRENDNNTRKRFIRIEVATVSALLLLELCNWFA